MLLEADTLIYDNNDETVTASGSVRIDYGGNKLVANQVTYDRRSRRLIATGDVQIVDPQGTTVYSDKIDITDDFGDGFVNALRVETVDKTYFAAESGERRGGFLTTFNNGVYTACEPCEDQPDKAPPWRIKAKKIIWNQQTKTVRFENSSFEFFGLPLGNFPSFEIADPTVKRKSGFLFPGVTFRSDLGVGVSIPYYIALSPTYDLTVTGTGYTEQGFLAEAEWRQRFNNGEYTVTLAGINQANPEAFDRNTVDSGPDGDPNEFRGMMGTSGRFALNSRWDFGWDVLVQTDKNFSRTYGIGDYTDFVYRSEVYLTGLDDRNYFDLRGMHFDVQESNLNTNPNGTENFDARDQEQPWVLPSFDYSYTPDEPVFGGELNFDLNARVISRDKLDYTLSEVNPAFVETVNGIENTSSRLTAEGEWKRSFVSDGGLVMTPLLAFQADTTSVNYSSESVTAIENMASNPQIGVLTDIRDAYHRLLATAGLELRFPLLFASENSNHVIEPMAQLFARNDEPYSEKLGIPNEDAQSFVFDATSLFERDKFSGYDRIEGGTRANVGFRYSGAFGNGWIANGIVGQSYHLAGENSFAAPDLVNAGAYSGLETDTSDFVGLIGFASPDGLSASASARLDEQTLEVRRSEVKAGYTGGAISVSAMYAFIQAQELYGFDEDRRELSLGGSARLHENWRVFGSGTYDFETSVMVKSSLGFAYDDECFTYLMTFAEDRDRDTGEATQNIGFNISFRTLGDFGSATDSVSGL
ncbi:LPS-assembly protein LptD [Mesorhizobium sp. KR9-304]|uniref:LPS-assembly protein LptD n=1 Tax=Mesorhizobium sp. KR9-304 TaxID=3156614 RepID=UPI0032B33EA5